MSEKVSRTTIDELIQDDKNFNKGTKRGAIMMKHSIETLGLGRLVICFRTMRRKKVSSGTL